MKKPLAYLVATLVLLGGFAAWWYSAPQVLKRNTGKILKTLTLEKGAGQAKRQLGVYSLGALLAPQVEFETPTLDQANGLFERSEIESAYSWLCDQAKECRFTMLEIQSIEVNDGDATVVFTLDAKVEIANLKIASGTYLATFHWRLEDDHSWLLTKASWDHQ